MDKLRFLVKFFNFSILIAVTSLCNFLITNHALSTMSLSLDLSQTIVTTILVLDIIPIITILFPHRRILLYALGIWVAVSTVNVYISFVGITNMATTTLAQPSAVIIGYFFVFFVAAARLILVADSYFVGISHPQVKK